MSGGPLEGLKVLDFTWSLAGPKATGYLADFGAMVIKLESQTAPDIVRVTAPYKDDIPGLDRSYHVARTIGGKLSVSIDLRRREAKAVVLKLVAWADVVVEAFAAGTMKKWGFDYPELHKVNPGLIMVTCNVFGNTTEEWNARAFGGHITGFAGFHAVTGWPDRAGTTNHEYYTDFIGAWYTTLAVFGALQYRDRTGKGVYIDVSQLEGGMTFLTEALMRYQATEREPRRSGNRCAGAAPHGVFPCQGPDHWCAIAVHNDVEWRGLGRALRHPSWFDEKQFSARKNRKAAQDELDRLVSSWTVNREAQAIVELLQQEGVPSAVVATAADLMSDPQLNHRQFIQLREHPELGPHLRFGWPVKISGFNPPLNRAPLLGEHTVEVLGRVCGLSDEEILDLDRIGVLR